MIKYSFMTHYCLKEKSPEVYAMITKKGKWRVTVTGREAAWVESMRD